MTTLPEGRTLKEKENMKGTSEKSARGWRGKARSHCQPIDVPRDSHPHGPTQPSARKLATLSRLAILSCTAFRCLGQVQPPVACVCLASDRGQARNLMKNARLDLLFWKLMEYNFPGGKVHFL